MSKSNRHYIHWVLIALVLVWAALPHRQTEVTKYDPEVTRTER